MNNMPMRIYTYSFQINKKYFHNPKTPSPDRSDILFLAPLARKRYSGWLEIAPKN